MKFYLRSALFFLLTGFSSFIIAQGPSWEATLGGIINWQRLTPFGVLIVSTSEGVKGVDPETGSILWTTKQSLGAAPESSFNMIENTPFFSLQSGSGSNEDFCIIESFEGAQVFSSIDVGMQKVNSQYFLHLSGAILVLGSEYGSKDPSVFMIDMATGKKIWSKEASFGIVTACKDLGNNECILTTGMFAIKMDVRTGNEVWKKCIDPKMEAFSGLLEAFDKGTANLFDPSKINAAIVTTPNFPSGVFVSIQSSHQKQKTDSQGKVTTENYIERNYMAFSLKDGSPLWPALKKIPGPVGVLYAGKEGLVVSQGEYPKGVANLVQVSGTDVYCFDYATGEGKWGKKGNGINVKGGVLRTISAIDGQLLLVTGRDNNFIDMVDPETGTSVVDKEMKVVGQVEYISKIGAGILYATTDEVNIIDFKAGEKKIDKSFKATASLIIDNENELLVFNNKDKILYKIDTETGISTALSSEIDWEGKEQAKTLEKRPEGYLISSDQNMVLVTTDGKIVYNKYFPAPTDNGWKKALYYAKAIFAAYASIVYSANAGLYGTVSQSIKVSDASSKMAKDITNQISDAYGDASKSSFKYAIKMVEKANKRYKATQQTNNYAYVLTTNDKKTAMLVRVDKTTGEIVNTIHLDKDKTPMYEVDQLDNRIFYKSSSNKIEGYKY